MTNVPAGAATVVDYDVAMEVASHEAIVRQAYRNPGDVWTWSVGLTSATGHDVERYIGKPQSLDHCLRVYAWALDNYADAVRRVFAGVPITKAQFAAACSFHWNTGDIEKATWVKLFKAGKIAEAKKAFMNYSKPASIIGRRKAERDLFFDGKWSNKGVIIEYTRVKGSGAIDWSSGKRINVEKEMRAALAGEIPASDKVIVEKPVKVEVPVEVEKPTVPKAIDKEVKQKTNWLTWLFGLLGLSSAGVSKFLLEADWTTVAVLIGGGIAAGALSLAAGVWIVQRVKAIRREWEAA